MKRSQRLASVLRLARQNREAAEQQLGQAQEQRATEETRLEQLESYLHDYQQAELEQGRVGISAAALQRIQVFKSRLSTALEQQQGQIKRAEHHLALCTQRWRQARSRYLAVEKLYERVLAQESREEDRRLQRLIDDAAANTASESLF